MTSRKQSGVTLIELLIAVAIVAILAAIAYPSYQRYVARTQRNAATACMAQYAQGLERHYTGELTYVGAPVIARPLPCSSENSLNLRYTTRVRPGSVNVRAYIVEAVPIGTQATVDAQCGTLTLDQTGARNVTGTAGTNACWR